MRHPKGRSLALLSALALSTTALTPAASADIFKDFVDGGEIKVSGRYRLEVVDQDGFNNDATASTLRTLVGVKTGKAHNLQGFLQFRNVTNVGWDSYNSTINGKTQYPVVADPEATEVDQAYLTYFGVPKTQLTFGRRKMTWGNQRYVSELIWRQHGLSYDGAFLETKPTENIEFKYAYIFGVNRPFSHKSPVGRFDGDIHFANLGVKLGPVGKLTGYYYDYDIDEAAALSTRTFGANLTGSQKINDNTKFGYVLEYANQKDAADNPNDLDLSYYHVQPWVSYSGFKLRGGIESLEGNGTRGYSTPFGLLHAFNGWADKFLITPANGLEDVYGELSYKVPSGNLKGMRFVAAYHDFSAENGSQDYGTEWDFAVSKKFGRFGLLAKAAFYDSDGFATDTTKFWLQVMVGF